MTTLSEIDKVELNGVINTGEPVMANLENIANTSYTWITYDITTGKWSVVINQPSDSVKSFDNDNIIGAVDLTTTPLDKMYNGVQVQFPDLDINDSNRFVQAQLNAGEYNSNESENILRLTYPLIHDQIQALHLGLTELKQSRLDKVVAFNTDYSSYGIRAGDVIDVTVDTYGFSEKLFRVLQVEEIDTTSGGIEIRITAQEYSDSIYEHDLLRFTLSNNDGIFALGDIGPMSQPTITVTDVDQRPNILIESVFADFGAPVTEVEIWAYPVTEPDEIQNWNNPLVYPDSARQYNLVETKQSSSETFELGADFSHTIYDLNPGNWLIKLRPLNALTKGPFTTPGALTVFEPEVRAETLNPDTAIPQLEDIFNLANFEYSRFYSSESTFLDQNVITDFKTDDDPDRFFTEDNPPTTMRVTGAIYFSNSSGLDGDCDVEIALSFYLNDNQVNAVSGESEIVSKLYKTNGSIPISFQFGPIGQLDIETGDELYYLLSVNNQGTVQPDEIQVYLNFIASQGTLVNTG